MAPVARGSVFTGAPRLCGWVNAERPHAEVVAQGKRADAAGGSDGDRFADGAARGTHFPERHANAELAMRGAEADRASPAGGHGGAAHIDHADEQQCGQGAAYVSHDGLQGRPMRPFARFSRITRVLATPFITL